MSPTVAEPGADATWRDLYEVAAARLGQPTEARWMVEEVSGGSWADVLLAAGPGSERPLPSAPARARLAAMVERRLAGEPLQYVLGRWAFRTLDLMVDRRVLIPRPETEQVVEVALAELDRLARNGPPPSGPDSIAVDLGTGSGAIALSIAAERPRVRIWATDESAGALAVARANLCGLGGRPATRVRLCEGSWWSALPAELRGAVDLVVSNPPYVSSAEMPTLAAEVSGWEPRTALEAGPMGLEAVSEILGGAAGWLRRGGTAVIEIAPHQADAGRRIARAAGFGDADVRPDLAGRDRVLVARDAP